MLNFISAKMIQFLVINETDKKIDCFRDWRCVIVTVIGCRAFSNS